MTSSLRVGQMWCLGATIILMSILPWRPASSGAPYARMQETAAVWIGYTLLIWGMRGARTSIGSLAGDAAQAKRLKAGLNAASGAMCVTALAALVSLTGILATTLEGGGVLPPLPFLESYLYPPKWNRLLLAPLLFALTCHAALLVMQVPRATATPWTPMPTVCRTLLLVVLALALAIFLLTALGSLGKQLFVVGAVVVTWFAGWVFLGLAIEQLSWSARLPLPGESPFARH